MGVDIDYCKKHYQIPDNIERNIAIDVGANIGGFSLAHHNVFNKIIFFEANYDTYLIAKNNTKDIVNIEGYNLAVSDISNKNLKLMNHFSKKPGSVSCSPSVVGINNDWNEILGEVKSISLEDVFNMINNQKINYLKLDCENSEYEILMNKDMSNIDFIAMEIHCQMGEKKYKQLINYLSKYFKITGNYRFNSNKNKIIYLSK